MNIEFDVTLQCNFSCTNCNRHSNFNDLSSPHTGGKKNQVGLDFYENVGYLTNSHGLEYVSDEQAIETAASNGDTTEYVKSFLSIWFQRIWI